MTRYELKRTSDEQFLFNLKAVNNEIILTSERYRQKEGALNGIESVRTNSPLEERFERRTSTDDKPYFVLKASNGEIIGRSELYESKAALETGIRSVITNGPIAKLVDNSAEVPAPRQKPAAVPQPSAPLAAAAGAESTPPAPSPAPPAPSPLFPPQPPPPRPML